MRLIACLLATALTAAEPADPAAALRLPASGPELAAAARTWEAEVLLAKLSDAYPATRRGAARLAAALPVAADRLLSALLASSDSEVRRLGAAGLRGVDLPLADLAKLPDSDVLAALIIEHPSEDPLADVALGSVIQAWLTDPHHCLQAARLIASRGTVTRWGEPLLKALEHANSQVVSAAHDALQALTRTQRSLDAYAGDRRLLAQDWRDILAAKPSLGRPDPELMALVAELPAPEALTALLARGPAALAAIERAQADATRVRRRDLESAARLLAHGVPQSLYAALGSAAFADLDHADPARRMACLRKLVGEIRTRADADGLFILVCALDDGDSAVRATALDQLVRLSDEAKRFKRAWRIEAEGLFQPEQMVRRLRRCLREGGPDEQIAGLLLVGSLESTDLIDDVMALIMSPRDDVVGTALETIKQLQVGSKQIPALVRLSADPKVPTARRVLVITVLGKINQRGPVDVRNGNSGALVTASILRMVDDPEPRIATAAVMALADSQSKGAVLRNAIDKLFKRGLTDAALSISVDRREPEVIELLAQRVIAGGADADRAALALAEGLKDASDERSKAILAVGAKPELRAVLASASLPGHAALACELGLIDIATALSHVDGDADVRDRVLSVLANRAANTAEVVLVAEVAQRASTKEQRANYAIRRRALALAARSPDRLASVASIAKDLLDVVHTDSNNENDKRTRTLKLRDGTVLHVEATVPTKRDSWDDEELSWRLVGPPPPGINSADLAILATLVASLPANDDDDRVVRDLAVAWLAGSEPAPTLASGWRHHDDLCRLLAASWPTFRDALVTRIIADMKPGESSLWQLRSWLKLDPARLAPVGVQMLVAEEEVSDYEVKPVFRVVAVLSPERISELLPAILAKPTLAKYAGELIKISGPLLLPSALALAEGPGLTEKQAIAPLAVDAVDVLVARFVTWTPTEILMRAGSIRRLRSVNSAAVDAALTRVVARSDPAAAAWLRCGIPAEAGMLDAYRQAESSRVAELALVGSAFALKEGRLEPAAFLARVANWPSPVQSEAAAAAKRYCEGKWDALAEPAAALVLRLGARALPAWIAVLPPAPAVFIALAERVADPATADAVGGALAQRQARDPAWKAAMSGITAKAQGRLDWLREAVP